MTTQERISKLEGLLARIHRNAAQPRPPAASSAALSTTAATAPPAAPTAPPAAYAPHPAPPPVAFASPAPLPVAPPPPIPVANVPAPVATPPMPFTAPAPYSAPAPAAADSSVDDLLATEAAEPVDVDVPFETIPPVAEAPAAPSQAPVSEPIPLVAAHAQPPAPPPAAEDAFSLESEVSEVRMAPSARDSEVEVTVAALEAEAEVIATEELSEEDLVELTEASATSAPDVEINFDEEDEQPPASSQRSRVASGVEETLSEASTQRELEHEVPLKTPPPESGPQQAPPLAAMPAAAAPDVDALLDHELEIPTREAHAAVGPTAEQLGQTIDLEDTRGPALELAEPVQSSVPPAAEDLEVALPARESVGGYDATLMPPPEARDELEAHRRRREEDIAPPPESLAQLPSVRPAPAELVPVPAAPPAPEVVARPTPAGSAESFISVRESFRPASFVELLDASLRLGGA